MALENFPVHRFFTHYVRGRIASGRDPGAAALVAMINADYAP
jgi:hypothetical protein